MNEIVIVPTTPATVRVRGSARGEMHVALVVETQPVVRHSADPRRCDGV